MKCRIAALVILCAVSSAAPAFAQSVQVGDRVRLVPMTPNVPTLIGTLREVRGDTMFVNRDSTAAAGRDWAVSSELFALDRSAGRGSRTTEGALIGAAVGGFGVLLLSYAVESASDEACDQVSGLTCTGGFATGTVVLGFLGGALLGGIIGSSVTTERWERATFPDRRVGLRVAPKGLGARAGVSLSFGSPSGR